MGAAVPCVLTADMAKQLTVTRKKLSALEAVPQ